LHAIETYKLTKYYSKGSVRALEDLTLQIEPGQIFGLLGPNGAGKTTLLKLLLGICFPTRGEAKIFSKNIKDYRSHAIFGYLAENHRFPDFLNAQQILYYYGKMAEVKKSVLREKIPTLLKLVKLEEWGKVKIRKYSKGMLQRLGIAQALINDPELLFLDEPTDGIDPVGRREVRDILLELRNNGKTVFLNSHLLSEVERVSDNIGILKEGKLIERGSVQDFISIKDKYQFKLQNGEKNFTQICQRAKIKYQEQNGAFLVSVNDHQQLNHLIDEFRKKQINIEAIIPYKITLEDFFIEVIQEDNSI
jgi:ABC-2 type transport system ATP-binding protein